MQVLPKGVSKRREPRGVDRRTERRLVANDRKILVEEMIVGREIECGCISAAAQNRLKSSVVGEVLAAADFYDFDAKYNNAGVRERLLNPELPNGACECVRVKAAAEKIFNAVDGYGLVTRGFLCEPQTGRSIFNEINTLPGFTAISMYPMLWEAAGIPKTELIDHLIDLAFER